MAWQEVKRTLSRYVGKHLIRSRAIYGKNKGRCPLWVLLDIAAMFIQILANVRGMSHHFIFTPTVQTHVYASILISRLRKPKDNQAAFCSNVALSPFQSTNSEPQAQAHSSSTCAIWALDLKITLSFPFKTYFLFPLRLLFKIYSTSLLELPFKKFLFLKKKESKF